VAETLKQMITDHVFIPLVENKAFQQPAFVYAKDITKDEQKASEVVQISQAGDLQRACEKLLEGFSPQITEYQPGQGASVIQIPANVQLAEQAQPAGAGSQPTVTAAASSGLDVSAPAAGDIFNFIKDNLTISADDMGGIIERFHADMKRGLAGEESSLKMLIGYVDKPTGDETGEFMGFDFGGSNFRVLSVKLLGNGNIAEPVKMKKYPMEVEEDGRHLTLPADELFDFVAGSVADFLHAQGSVSGEGTIHSGFTFSFPISQTGIDEGRVGELTKGFANDGLLGANPVTLLRDAILRNSEVTQSGTNVQVDALCNDTIGTLVARAYSDPHCDVGVILGTGTNGAFFADLNSVPLYRGGPTHSGKMAINMEWGGFDKLRRTPYDVQLDNNSNNPGRQILEKMVSGKYLGENARLTLVDLIAAKELLQGLNGNVPPALKERYAFTVEGMAKIESDNSPDLDQVNVVLQGFGVENSTPNDRKLIKDVCAIVSTRAARVSASVTAGTIKWMDPEVTRLHTVAVDGSLFAEYPGFKERMETALGEIFKDRKQQISLVYAPDGSGKGAAVIAAVVASQQISTTSSAAAPQPGEGVTATVPHVTDREEQMIREAEESLGLGPYAVEMQMQVGFMQEVLERTDGKAVVTEKKAEGALREADICAHMMRELTNAGLSVVQGEQQGQRPPIYVFAPSLAILSKDPAFGNAYVIATENDRPAFDEMGFTNVTYGETLADARDNLIIKLQEEGLISEGAIRHIRYYFGEDEENIPSRLTSTFVMDLFQLILDPSGLNDLSNPDNNLRITVKDTEAFKSAIEAYRQLFNDL
jgi:hexokinase